MDLLEGTERWEASPHQARQSAEGLNEMTMDEVLSRENLNAAYRVVKANAGAPGVDGMSVEELTEHVRKHWDTLQSKLRTGEYQPAAGRGKNVGNTDRSRSVDPARGPSSTESDFRKGLQ